MSPFVFVEMIGSNCAVGRHRTSPRTELLIGTTILRARKCDCAKRGMCRAHERQRRHRKYLRHDQQRLWRLAMTAKNWLKGLVAGFIATVVLSALGWYRSSTQSKC